MVKSLLERLELMPYPAFLLPYSLILERWWTRKLEQSAFAQHATPFQDLVIRCVRYAFANMPSEIGRVFFSKAVSLPFLRFRMLRHGYLRSPIQWKEVSVNGVSGLLISHDESEAPDVIVYYCHGGGFAMGSAYFYLEPCLVLISLLKLHYRNPAVFALEYTLVPDAAYPTQLNQTVAGYEYALSQVANDASRICVAGDSAGATLVLSLLLHMAGSARFEKRRPAYCTLISPWVTLVSDQNRDTASDYLNADTLHTYGSQYAATTDTLLDPLVSPGRCNDLELWAKAAPSNGMYITYGSEEILAHETCDLILKLRKSQVSVRSREEPGAIHAWAIASLFLEDSLEQRISGMAELTKAIVDNI